MKPLPNPLSGDSSLTHESKRTIGENLRRIFKAAAQGRATTTNDNVKKHGCFSISKQIERRNWRNHAEDPIRTMMFLASWCHT
ncbi:Histidine--tRNA ligase [Quillaja saponaria]|uniref:Histidine--tRNA ligase n=1 Tax=Quillaja saponaria TaxID=32244 RepID=A0AAD7VEJ8_QUISA|nr:Histidine--tRNA ligase [Quillaja saponaria]